MQTQLPRRPYSELAPPPDGLAAARREASRRRTRRVVAGVGGAVTAGVVGAVVLLVGGGSDVAMLRPAPVAPATQPPAPSPAAVPTTGASGHRGVPAHGATTPRSSGRGPGVALHPTGGATTSVRHSQPDAASVTVTRTSGRNPGGPQVCRTGASSNDSTVHPGDDWCPTTTAVAVSGGERLTYGLCRDSTTGGTLHFAGSREIELVVVRNGATVWRYSAHDPGTSTPHSLTAAADDCWTWSLVWPGVADDGSAVGSGRYTVQATSSAQEFVGAPAHTATFDY